MEAKHSPYVSYYPLLRDWFNAADARRLTPHGRRQSPTRKERMTV